MTERGPYHQTLTGRLWYPYDPRPEEVHFRDLLAIKNVCRFGGHVMDGLWYSNLDHSLRVAELLEAWDQPSHVVLQGAGHDLHEAYPPGDQIGPIIRTNHPYAMEASGLSRMAANAVRTKLGLPLHLSQRVKLADTILLATERRDIMAPSDVDWGALPDPLPETITPRSITDVELRFLQLIQKHGATWAR